MKQLEEEEESWKNLLERLLDHLGLKLVIFKPGSIIMGSWSVAIADASRKYTCMIYNLPEESAWRPIDTKYGVVYPKSQISGSSEEEACSRMLRAIAGTEVRWMSTSKEEKDPEKIFVNHVAKVPKISTSSIYAARMSLDILLG